ncbi:MAG: rhomboid family intramembrane serine protease [Kiritimatiellae bacterium]|nr:rhomboid family intramembrane serine protease [Kiritimatiellia bacterium]
MLEAIRRFFWRVRWFCAVSPAVCWLTGICLAVYFAQSRLDAVTFAYGYSFADVVLPCFAMDVFFFKGFFWQPVTYMFLHGGGWHLACNLFTVVFFGSALERAIGARRFWKVFFFGGVLGGIGWLLVTYLLNAFPAFSSLTAWIPESIRARWHLGMGSVPEAEVCIGASGGVFSLIGAYAALFPYNEVRALLFFVIPVKLKARTLAVLIGVFTIAEAVFVQSQIAYAAHLVGGVAGYLLARYWSVHYGRYR